MTQRTLQITVAAEADLRDARDWYEGKAAGLGERFLSAVDRVFMTIETYPMVGEHVDEFNRGFPVPGFPYRVYYRVVPSHFEVVAVLHTARDPANAPGNRGET